MRQIRGLFDLSAALHADLARKYGMKVHSWTHRADSLWKPFKTSDEELDVALKELKLDGLFSDCPDVVIDYLKRNGIQGAGRSRRLR